MDGGAKRSFTSRKLPVNPILPHQNAIESALRVEWPCLQIQSEINSDGGSLTLPGSARWEPKHPNLRVIQPVVEPQRAAEALKLHLDFFRFFYYLCLEDIGYH